MTATRGVGRARFRSATYAVALALGVGWSVSYADDAPADEVARKATQASVSTAPLPLTGSSSVVPYALVAANLPSADPEPQQTFPVLAEATGTAAGLAALCRPGEATLAGASRPVNATELATCQRLGVDTVIEVQLGLGAIVLVQSAEAAPLSLSALDLFVATADRLPVGPDCIMSPNRRRRWSEVRADLPDRPINIYGPPVTSGARDVLTQKALAVAARSMPCLAALEAADPAAFINALAVRTDGAWVDAGESDGATAFAMTRLPDAVGIVGRVHALAQDGLTILPFGEVHATPETITDGRYPLPMPLYVYATAGAVTKDPRVRPLIAALSRPAAIGPGGRLTQMGLSGNAAGTTAKLISTEDGAETPITLGN